MDRGSKIFNFFADLLGCPTLNDVDDYVPIKPENNNYIGEDLDFPPLPDEEDFFASPVPEDDDDFDGIAPAVPE